MTWPIKLFKISGHSMEPAIKAGSFVLVWCWVRHVKPGDIVAFEHDGKILIKRIAEIKNEHITVLGDNPNDSLDSRSFGSITINQVLGKVIVPT